MSRSKNKLGLDYKALSDYAEKLEKIGGDVKVVVTEILQKAHDMVTEDVEREMQKHNKTGETSRSILRDARVEWTGTVGSIDVGFDIANGGIASIFLMYGTPRHEPGHPGTEADKALYDAVYGRSKNKKIKNMMEETMEKAIERRLKG